MPKFRIAYTIMLSGWASVEAKDAEEAEEIVECIDASSLTYKFESISAHLDPGPIQADDITIPE